ncbi:hypothetical protein P261_02571 [Lachnospiraceae bacterium TWA4]|nr:hypothetical protein P261_02571 [Lachnospiraceae bacterium TWA4]
MSKQVMIDGPDGPTSIFLAEKLEKEKLEKTKKIPIWGWIAVAVGIGVVLVRILKNR